MPTDRKRTKKSKRGVLSEKQRRAVKAIVRKNEGNGETRIGQNPTFNLIGSSVSVVNAITDAVKGYELSSISKGDGINKREGNGIYIKAVHLSMTLFSKSVTQSKGYRILVLTEKSTAQMDTTNWDNMLTKEDFSSYTMLARPGDMNYPVDRTRYIVHYDRKGVLPIAEDKQLSFRKLVPIKHVYQYDPVEVTTVPVSGRLLLVVGVCEMDDVFNTATAIEIHGNLHARVFFSNYNKKA